MSNPLDSVNQMEELEANIFWPGIYNGRQDAEWHVVFEALDRDIVIAMVQKRAEEDGDWAIEKGLVGPNDLKMRVMIGFVSNPEMIAQALDHPSNKGQSVDYICRDLANASKVVANA